MDANSEVRIVLGWKFFLVLMMLFWPSRGGTVSWKKDKSRVWQVKEGD